MKLNGLARMITKYVSLKEQISVSELARSIVEETGLLRLLKEENTPDSLTRRENIQELVSALSEFSEHHPGAQLEDFLEEVSLVSDVDTADFERNAVTLMTVHAAKGLEFPVVCIAGLEEGIFPISGSMGSQGELEEERRLMYVGMTRAREGLHLLYAGERFRFGERTFMARSRFLDEIDQSLVAIQNRSDHRPLRAAGNKTFARTIRRPARPVLSDEWVDPEPAPQYDDEAGELRQPRVGLRVIHLSFGRGKIVAIQGTGDSAKALVDFETVGKKQLLLKFAGLTAE
jgi:DNA helicase-2/ATP-dependent DNA helicase PcrA